MTVQNHWGIWVDSESPITGVINNGDIAQFISDESYNAIDLDFEAFTAELINSGIEEDSDDYQEAIESYESQDATLLIGDWTKDSDGLYIPDKSGEYSAIVRESTTQVVWSKYTTRAPLCSPCYPGQADVSQDYSGEYTAYTLPKEAFTY